MDQKKEKLGSRIKASFGTRKFRGGAYATVLSAVAIALVIIVNLLVTKLDIQVDMTDDKKYSLDSETIKLLQGVTDDITIYYLVESGNEYVYFDSLFTKYDDYNSHVKIEYKDPVLHPKFASQYVEDEVSTQSFLVVNETTGKAKYVSNTDAIETQIDYNTYQYQLTGISLESALDGAIQYVTNNDLPVMYAVTGHGESKASETMKALLEKSNITLNEVTLVTENRVPEDCDVLFLYQPQSDYVTEETDMIREYLAGGGYAVLVLDYTTPELTNFNELLQYYGMDVHEGVVLEGSSKYYMFQAPYVVKPTVYSSDITDSIRTKKYVAAQLATGITMREDIRESIKVEKLLVTSDTSYIKPVSAETLEKEEGDLSGPFCVGVKLTETVDSGETKIAVYSAKYFLEDTLISNASYGNMDIFVNTINSFTEQENAVSVPVKSLSEEQLTLTAAQANRTALCFAVILPLCIIGIGIYVVVRRRKK